MLSRSALYAVTLFFACAFPFSVMQAETFNGPTTLKDKNFDDLTINGPANLVKVRAKTLTVKGPLKFYQIEVMGNATVDGRTKGSMGRFQDLTIKGPFKAKKITAKSLDVTGPAKLVFFTIMDNSLINGPLDAQKGRFQDLTVGPDLGIRAKVLLEDVSANNVVIKSENGQEILQIEGDSDIAGTVTFESKKGKIEKKGSEFKSVGAPKEAPAKS